LIQSNRRRKRTWPGCSSFARDSTFCRRSCSLWPERTFPVPECPEAPGWRPHTRETARPCTDRMSADSESPRFCTTDVGGASVTAAGLFRPTGSGIFLVSSGFPGIFGHIWLLFVTTFWLFLVNSLAIKFSSTWQPCQKPTRNVSSFTRGRYHMHLVVEAVEIHTLISFSTQQVGFQFSTCCYS